MTIVRLLAAIEARLLGARRPEAALVADERRVAAELLLDDALERREHLAARAHAVGEGRRA